MATREELRDELDEVLSVLEEIRDLASSALAEDEAEPEEVES